MKDIAQSEFSCSYIERLFDNKNLQIKRANDSSIDIYQKLLINLIKNVKINNLIQNFHHKYRNIIQFLFSKIRLYFYKQLLWHFKTI